MSELDCCPRCDRHVGDNDDDGGEFGDDGQRWHVYCVAAGALDVALEVALGYCENYGDGSNLPEMLAQSLESLARARGGSHALVAQRPGSWEATHVAALAAGADW